MPLPKGYELTNAGQTAQNYQQNYKPPSREEIDIDKENFANSEQAFQDWDWQNSQTGPNGEQLPELATGWKPDGTADFGTGLKGFWNKAVSSVNSAWETGYDEGLKISGVTEFTVKDFQGQEKGQQTLDKMKEDRRPDNENQAVWAARAEATKEVFNQALWGVLDGLSQPAIWAEQAIGTAGHSIDRAIAGEEINKETLSTDWQASRLAYSSMFDATVYEEMKRRIDDGVRSDLAAQEVMIDKKWTMWPELIGQMIFDPLNALSVVGKAGKAARIEKNAAKTFHEVTNPAVAKMLDDISEISKLDDATAYSRIEELVKSQQALTTAAAHADDIADAGKDLEALSNSYKLSSLTRDGKIAHVANETGEILMHVVNNSSPDEALEILRGMVKSVSKDPKDAAEGISAMLHFADPKALFSKAGNDTTVLISKMYEKHGDKWLKTLEELKGNPAELTKNLMSKLDEVGEEMFPSVSKMLEAEKAVVAGGEVSEATRALADRAKQLPNYVKSATRFHDTAQKVVGPVNKFFIGAYMGWSPGFAFRNFSNNSMQLLIDYGPGILLGKADDVFAKAEKLHGGALQGAFSEGGMAASLFPEARVTAQATDAKAVIEAAKSKGLKGPVLGMSQTLEANAAKRIIAKTYRQTFDKGVKALQKALTPALKEAGFSDDIIRKLPTYILNHDGDATKVIQALRTDVASGVIDLFNDVSRIDPKYKSFLSDAGKWDEYAEKVLQAPTREEAGKAAEKIFNDLAEAGDYAYRDARPAVGVDNQFLKMAEEQAGMPSQRGQMVSLRTEENRKVISAAEQILSEADNLGARLGLDVGTMKKAKGIQEISGWGSDAAKEAQRVRDLIWDLNKQSKKGGANLGELWTKYPEFFQGTPPQGLNSQSFRDALWHSFDGVMSKNWGGARDKAVDGVLGYLDDLEKAGAQIDPKWKDTLKMAQEGAQQYDGAMVGRFGELVEETPMPFGSRTSQINAIANSAGIPTATAEGLATDKKTLSIINKYADVSYKSLEDVPLDVAKEAFAKKAGKAVQPELKAAEVTAEEATKLPRSELPEEVSQRIAEEAKRLKNELYGGEGPGVNGITGNMDETARRRFGTTNVSWYRELYQKGMRKPAIDKALDKILIDSGADKGATVEKVKDFIMDTFRYGDKTNGVPPDLKALQALGADEKTLAEALDDYNDITKQEKTLEEVLGIAPTDEVSSGAQVLEHDPDLPYYDDAGNLVEPARKRILPPAVDGEAPTASRAIYEQRDEIGKMRQWVMDDIGKNFGKKQLIDKVSEGALKTAEKELTQKLAETKLISSRVAQANRDFTLLNYGQKSYWDTALAYLYPFHYWYGGTYKNWMKRIASNPAILGHYARYKDILGTVHAGMPEWWKYNINSNDLPGVDVENPLYFNLEATLWPLNGITGTDFNDASKRVNWWTYSLDYANKFGPSTWTPLSMVTGLALYAQGEREAGEKWMGRLIPQSNPIKAAGSMLGIANLETDPFVSLLQGGLDPYERRRVDRALAEMQQQAQKGDLPYTPEQILDAAYTQEGEIWDEAVKRAVRGRAPSQISSYLFGVGFKGRTQEDMQVDQFFTDQSKLFTMRPNLSPDEFREGMDALKKKYPFGDTVMLSRRDGIERDTGLAYSVMTRIPPGKSSELAKAAGIDPELLNKFYADKGQIEKWSAGDRAKFMSGILTMSAVLEIPTDMTRGEWTKAKNAYSGLSTEAKTQFGDDILDVADGYYQAKTVSSQKADQYMDNHPELAQYMDWKAQRIMQSPLLSAYYGGASQIEGYYRSQMYKAIETELGKEIFDTLDEYNQLKTFGESGESKAFYNQHRAEIKKYYQLKDEWSMTINQQTAQLTAKLPEGEDAGIREDIDPTSVGAQNLANALQPEEQPTLQDFQQQVPERLFNLVLDYYNNDEPLPESAQRQLDRVAKDLGYQYSDDLLQAIGTSLYSQQTP